MTNLATTIDQTGTALPMEIGAAQIVTPMTMIDRALMTGAAPETLEKLLALQERWEANQGRRAFDEAMAAAKAEIRVVSKNAKGHNNKAYADFAAYSEEVTPILARHGLSFRFRSDQTDRISVTCIISHREGHSEQNTLSGPADNTGNKNAIQAIGSTLTYLQRYTLVQALGLAAAEDDDGQKSSQNAALITAEQRDTILRHAKETDTDIQQFCDRSGFASVADIPARDFESIVRLFEDKKRKRAGQQ